MQKQLTCTCQMTIAFMMSFSTTACPSGSVCLWRTPQFTHHVRTLKSAPEGIPSGYNEAWMQFELKLDLGQGFLEAKWRCCFSEFTYLNDWFGFLKQCKAWPPKQPDASSFWNQVWPYTTWFPLCGHLPSQLFHSTLFRLSHYTVMRHQTHSHNQQHSRLFTTKHSYAEAFISNLWAKKENTNTEHTNAQYCPKGIKVKGWEWAHYVLRGSMKPSQPKCSGDGLGLKPVGLGQWAWRYLLR